MCVVRDRYAPGRESILNAQSELCRSAQHHEEERDHEDENDGAESDVHDEPFVRVRNEPFVRVREGLPSIERSQPAVAVLSSAREPDTGSRQTDR